jgi:hypothetical protein
MGRSRGGQNGCARVQVVADRSWGGASGARVGGQERSCAGGAWSMLAVEVNSSSRELGVMSGLTRLWTDHFGLGLGRTGIGSRNWTENWTGPSPDSVLRNC